MPVTRRAVGVRAERVAPDYDLAMRPVRALGLAPDDPVLALAEFCVRRGDTDQTVRGYGWMIARFLRDLRGS